MPELRAFAICPTCSELYPSFRGCPSCDRDTAMTTRPAQPPPLPPPPVEMVAVEPMPAPAARTNVIPALAVLSLGVVVACGVLMALLAS